MKTLALVCLLIFTCPVVPQTQPDQTIAIVQNGRVEIVKLSAAKAEYEVLRTKRALNSTEYARFVALTISLGSIATGCTAEQEFAVLCLRQKPAPEGEK